MQARNLSTSSECQFTQLNGSREVFLLMGQNCQFVEPRWRSGLRCWFTIATHQGMGFRMPPLPRLSLAGSHWSDIIGSSLRGRGEASAGDNLDCRIPSTSGAWNHGKQASSCGLKKAYVSQDRWILTERGARDGVYAANPKLIARGNWRNVGEIGRKF